MKEKEKQKRDWLPGVLMAAAISFLLFLYAPVDLYCSNIDEFWFDFDVLLRMAAMMFGISLVTLTLLYLLAAWIHPYFYRIGLAVGLAVLLITYVQGNFLVGNLPVLDGTSISWEDYSTLRTESVILCIVVLTIVALLFLLLKKQLFGKACMYISACLSLMLLVTAITEVLGSDALEPKLKLQISTKNEFVMSGKQNFLIFMLDAADSREFSYLLEQNPEYRDIFADFTYYENTVGAYSCTRYAVPYILSGKWYECDTSFEEYMEDLYDKSPLIEELENRNYRIGLYEPDLHAQNNDVLRFDNIFEAEFKVKSYFGMARQELKLVGYRYAPYWLKKYCVLKQAAFDEQLEAGEGSGEITASMENRVFLDHLNAGGITVDDTENSFKFIHLEGAHSPYVYDAEVNIIDESQGTYAQNMEASVTLSERYLSALKKSGTYDNTAIIVMSDHGFNRDIDNADMGDNPFMRQCGLLLIKGVGEKHDTMQISEAPVSYEDLQEAYRRLLDGAWSDTVFDCREGDHRDRRYLWYAVTDEDYLVEYQQTGYASDLSTMLPTGREFRWTKQ